jgi:DNA mismatch repair ATPase MutL
LGAGLKFGQRVAENDSVAVPSSAPLQRMESVNEIKEALSARSRTATLDELRNEGKKRVRLIRAEHVAAMISEAVHAAIEQSGLIAPEEAEKLVEKSRQEFRSILREREQEQQRAHETEDRLSQRENELAELKRRFTELSTALASTKAACDEALAEAEAARAAAAAAEARPPIVVAAPAQPAAAPDFLLSLVQEMATLKANLMQQQAQPAPQAAPAPDFTAALEKLTGSLNERLEKLGKKMGVSAAVESDAPVDFSGMFKDSGKELESNMQNIEVKQKAGGGIAANLARLKKLKGG